MPIKSKIGRKYAKVQIEAVDYFPPEALRLIPKTDALKTYANDDAKVLQRWTATLDDKIVGLVTIETPAVHGLRFLVNTQYLQVIVAPSARGKGIGESLVKRAIKDRDDQQSHLAGFTHHSDGFKHLAKKYGIRDNDDVSRYDEEDEGWQDDGTHD